MRPGPGERSVFRDVLRRQWDARRRRRPHVGHPTFIDGLRLTNVLERHSGCVNALAWNDDATLLLSGSDDLCVCVWTTGAGFPCRGSVYTGHVNNIFSNEFVPHSGSARCVTTAGDGDVRLVDLERGVRDAASDGTPRAPPRRRWVSDPDDDSPAARSLFAGDAVGPEEAGMGMKVRFAPGDPNVFLVTHQDGRVRRFDLRAPVARGANRAVVVDLSVQGSTSDIAFDPTNPSLFAVGCDDPFVRVFDVRHASDVGPNASRRRRASSPSEREHPALIPVVAKYSPGTACGFNTRRLQFDGVSGLAYSARGELAVTYRGEHLYVIDKIASADAAGSGGDGWGRRHEAGGGTRVRVGRGWTAGGSGEGYGAEEGRSPSPEFGYASPESAEREREPGREREDDATRADADSDEDEDRDSDEDEEDDGDDSVPASSFPDRRSASVPRDRSATPGARGDAWSLFDEDPALASASGVKRYVGHKNVKTFLKGVAFACDDAYVTTGGDCGGMFVWNKETCELVCRAQADGQVVNNVCPHPSLPVLVTSGIDDEIRVWQPGEGHHLGEIPSRRDEDTDDDETADFEDDVMALIERGFEFQRLANRGRRGPEDDDDDGGGFPRGGLDEDSHDEAFASESESRDDDRPPGYTTSDGEGEGDGGELMFGGERYESEDAAAAADMALAGEEEERARESRRHEEEERRMRAADEDEDENEGENEGEDEGAVGGENEIEAGSDGGTEDAPELRRSKRSRSAPRDSR